MELQFKNERLRGFWDRIKSTHPTRSQIILLTIVLVLLMFLARSMTQSPANMPNTKDVSASQRMIPEGKGGDTKSYLAGPNEVAGDGIVEPSDREIKIGASTAGRIAKIFVEEGQAVKANDPLLELDNSVEKAQLATAEAELGAAEANYKRVLHGLRPEDVQSITADALANKAKLENSKANLKRVLELEQNDSATAEELQRARDQTLADLNSYRSSEAKRVAAVRGSRSEDIEEAKARWQSALAKRDEAKATLERLTVYAPISGKILYMLYRPGEYYNPNNPAAPSPLFVMGDVSVLRARMDVDERDFSNVHLGASAFVTADSFPGRKFPGKVVEIGKRMGRKNVRTDDPTERIDTKILEVVIQLDPTTELLPGLRVTCYVNNNPLTN